MVCEAVDFFFLIFVGVELGIAIYLFVLVVTSCSMKRSGKNSSLLWAIMENTFVTRLKKEVTPKAVLPLYMSVI